MATCGVGVGGGGGLVYICWFSLSLRLCALFKKQSIKII